jgi:hypothetical protein
VASPAAVFCGRPGGRVAEPGEIGANGGRFPAGLPLRGSFPLSGGERVAGAAASSPRRCPSTTSRDEDHPAASACARPGRLTRHPCALNVPMVAGGQPASVMMPVPAGMAAQ